MTQSLDGDGCKTSDPASGWRGSTARKCSSPCCPACKCDSYHQFVAFFFHWPFECNLANGKQSNMEADEWLYAKAALSHRRPSGLSGRIESHEGRHVNMGRKFFFSIPICSTLNGAPSNSSRRINWQTNKEQAIKKRERHADHAMTKKQMTGRRRQGPFQDLQLTRTPLSWTDR